jgi:hypothetical protein
VEGAVEVAANHYQRDDQGAEQKQLGRQVGRDEIGDCPDNCRRSADEDEKRPRRECLGRSRPSLTALRERVWRQL